MYHDYHCWSEFLQHSGQKKKFARVLDLPPPAVEKMFKITKKQSLSSAFKNVHALNPGYQHIQILARGLKILLAENSDFNYLGLFQLFIPETHPALIAIHTNLDPAINQCPDLNKKNRKSGDNKPGKW